MQISDGSPPNPVRRGWRPKVERLSFECIRCDLDIRIANPKQCSADFSNQRSTETFRTAPMFSAAAFLLQAVSIPQRQIPLNRRFSVQSCAGFRLTVLCVFVFQLSRLANGLTALFHPPPAAPVIRSLAQHRDREAPPPALRRAQHSAALWRIRFRSRPRIPSRSSAPKRRERPAALRWKTGPSRPPSAQAPTDCRSRRNSNPSAEGIRNRSRALSARRRPLRTHAPAFHTRWGPKRPANRTERQTIRADGTQSGA